MEGGNAVVRQVVNGWQISGITTFSSGVELAASSHSSFRLSGFLPDGTRISNAAVTGTPDINAQPFLTCDPSQGLQEGQHVNGACFAPPLRGINGPYQFPYLRGPALFSNDLSLFKNFAISESKRFQFRASAYNFINHPLPTFVNNDQNLTLEFDRSGNLVNPDFGFATQKTGRRVVQNWRLNSSSNMEWPVESIT